ncbi:MAG: cytochrome P450 [Acidobacteriota bacterium]|nr:cytochrome P450 [Blastocatellia bacterium]MDW8412043.1 cytochrome P450 [Acidobacteriota bacterium]
MTMLNKVPPGPPSRPFLANFWDFRNDPTGYLLRVAREYGDVCSLNTPPEQVFLVNHPELIKEVFTTLNQYMIKGRALQRAKAFLGEGLLTSEGELHRRQRRLAQPAFHRQRIATYADTMVELAFRYRQRLVDGQQVDMAQEMTSLTMSIVAKTLFDADVEDESGQIGRALTELVRAFNLMILPFADLVQKIPLPGVNRFRRACGLLDEIIYGIISERRAKGVDRGDLLSMLIIAQDEEGSGGMTDQQLRDEVMTLFLAGHETTANALTWTWYLLAKHPEIERKLHEEIDSVLSGRRPSFDDVKRLKYAEMVLAESMRLYPPAWAVGRRTLVDVTLGDYLIPAGSLIIVSQYVMHRDARYYPEPEKFDPERFTAQAQAARPKYAYFPFGGGVRQCIGESFAWTEGVLLLATIASRWRFELVDEHVEPEAVVTLRPKNGCRMLVRERG